MRSEMRRLAGRLVWRSKLLTASLHRLRLKLHNLHHARHSARLRIARALRRHELRQLAHTRKPVVLLMVPEAGLTPFYASHVILARTLREGGYASIVLSCGGLLPSCNFKFAESIKPTAPGDRENRACRQCREQASRTADEYRLVEASLESLLGAKELDEIGKIVSSNRDALWNTEYQGIQFGQAALGETLRSRRLLSASELSTQDIELLNAVLFSSLAVYFAVNILSSRYGIARIASFGNYAIWIPSQILAKTRGISVTYLDHAYNFDVDQRFIGLQSKSSVETNLWQIERWPDYRDRAIEPEKVAEIAAGALFRLQGHGGVSTYSPNWVRRDQGLHGELGLSPERKTIVAFTSSSDELVAMRAQAEVLGRPFEQGPRPFADQRTWLQELFEWVDHRSDLQLMVRLHPRIAAGDRHRSVASEYQQLKDELTRHPANVGIIWPEEPVSSYNLAEIADGAVVAWSTIGIELARFGLPVVAAFPGIGAFPTGGFIAFEEDRRSYFEAVGAALERPASLTDITEAFRWTHFMVWSHMVDISDLIPARKYSGIPRWHLPRNHEIITRVLGGGEDIFELNMTRLSRGIAAEEAEREALLSAINRFILFFAVGEDRPGANIQKLLLQEDHSVVVETNGEVVRRYSPLIHRLATMLAGNANLATRESSMALVE